VDVEEIAMTLNELKPGRVSRISNRAAQNKLGQRLMDMGVYPGLMLKVVRKPTRLKSAMQ
jgi:ferrous iron transport protein A